MNVIGRIRQWWHDVSHAPCPVCGQSLDVGREWHQHKTRHDPDEWRAAVGLPPAGAR